MALVLFRLLVLATVVALGATAVYGLHRYLSDHAIEAQAARDVVELEAIVQEAPLPPHYATGSTQEARVRLGRLQTQVATVEMIARAVEHAMSAQSSGCRFGRAAGKRIAKDIAPAHAAVDGALGALLSETDDRIERVEKEIKALGWTGWRGSRQVKSEELALLAHDLAATRTRADLAFSRLTAVIAALNRASVTCR